LSALVQWLSEPGFSGTRAPLAADIVVALLVVVVPLFWWGRALVVGERPRVRLHAAVMSTLYVALVAVVTVFIVWEQTGAPRAPRLEAAWFYRPVYLPFLLAHIVSAVGALALGAGALVWAACFSSRGRSGTPRFEDPLRARTHGRIGRAFLWLVTCTALSGAGVYAFRYIY
jgi:uncharacterized membrane protein YozB (DUF420 family)